MTSDITHQDRPGRTYLKVALCTGGAGRWPVGTGEHVIDAVNLPCHPEPGVVDYRDHAEPFSRALADGAAVTLIATGKHRVDRPLFGRLVGAGDLLARSHPGHGLMRRVALVHRAEPNMSWVFNQAGIGIEFVGAPKRSGGQAVRGRPFPSTGEDWSIVKWWREHPRRGLLLAEVTVGRGGPGGWLEHGSSRAIDAIHLPGHEDQQAELWARDTDALAELVRNSEVEIVEAKKALNFDTIGQCLAGIVMFARSYPTHGPLAAVAVVRGTPDPALTWVCHRRGIHLACYPEEEIAHLKDSGGP
jgi:hypothetical protein